MRGRVIGAERAGGPSPLERLGDAPRADHEGVDDELERRRVRGAASEVEQRGAAAPPRQPLARRGFDVDIPHVLALVAPVEARGQTRALVLGGQGGEDERGGDGRVAAGGIDKLRAFDEDRLGRDLGQDRQRVDAGVEDAEIAGVPNPLMARVETSHVLSPVDREAAQLGAGKPRLGDLDGGVVLRTPGGEDDAAALGEARRQVAQLGHRRRWRLLQQHVLAGGERLERQRMARRRRRAQRHRVDLRQRGVGFGGRAEMGSAVGSRRLPADQASRAKTAALGDDRQAAIAGHLADANERERIRPQLGSAPCAPGGT